MIVGKKYAIKHLIIKYFLIYHLANLCSCAVTTSWFKESLSLKTKPKRIDSIIAGVPPSSLSS